MAEASSQCMTKKRLAALATPKRIRWDGKAPHDSRATWSLP